MIARKRINPHIRGQRRNLAHVLHEEKPRPADRRNRPERPRGRHSHGRDAFRVRPPAEGCASRRL